MTNPVMKYEYKVVSLYCMRDYEMTKELNAHGAEGWELVSTGTNPGQSSASFYAFFLRPVS